MIVLRHLVRGRAVRVRHPLLALACLAALLPTGSIAATDEDREAVREQLASQWYYTEVIIFHRPAVLDFLSEEALTTDPGAGFPATLLSLAPAPVTASGVGGQIRDEDPACLAFPAMDARALAAAEALALANDGALAADSPGRTADAGQATQEQPAVPAPVPEPRLAYDPLLDYLNSVGEFEDSLEARSLIPLAPERLTLGSEAARIDADRRFQVLWHGGWLQATPEREAPVPLLIQAGHRWGEVYQLEGTMDVTLGRYLHFHARLLYHEPLLGEAPADHPVPPTGAEPEATLDAGEPGIEESAVPAALTAVLNPGEPRFMVLDESRRMRSSELHYLDHPKLGVLVRIEPVEVPDSLVDAYLTLEESPE